MSTAPERLLGWFLSPSEAEARVTAPLAFVPQAVRCEVVAPAADLQQAPAGAGPGRVCVLGRDASAVAFGLALAQRLARAPGGRAAVACVWSEGRDEAPARRSGPPTAASRRLAAALVAGGHEADLRGRVVRVRLPVDPGAAAAAFESVDGRAGSVGVVAILVGARSASLDAVLARQDVVLAVVVADAPSALTELAERSLTSAAPAAAVRAVALPSRLAGPARRAAVIRALEPPR